MYMEKIEQLMNSEEFVQKLNMTNCTEDMKELFAQYGVEVPLEELNKLVDSVKVGADGELNEDTLDNVAGGGWIQKFWEWLCNRNTEGVNDAVNTAMKKKK